MSKIDFCYSENDELIQIYTNDSIASEILLRLVYEIARGEIDRFLHGMSCFMNDFIVTFIPKMPWITKVTSPTVRLTRVALKTIERKRIFKINSDLLKDSEKLEFKVKNQEIEKKLNLGIFQFEDYLAFYINLTAYGEQINSQESTNDPDGTRGSFWFPDWYGTVRGTDFWSEILFGPVRGTEFGMKIRYRTYFG